MRSSIAEQVNIALKFAKDLLQANFQSSLHYQVAGLNGPFHGVSDPTSKIKRVAMGLEVDQPRLIVTLASGLVLVVDPTASPERFDVDVLPDVIAALAEALDF